MLIFRVQACMCKHVHVRLLSPPNCLCCLWSVAPACLIRLLNIHVTIHIGQRPYPVLAAISIHNTVNMLGSATHKYILWSSCLMYSKRFCSWNHHSRCDGVKHLSQKLNVCVCVCVCVTKRDGRSHGEVKRKIKLWSWSYSFLLTSFIGF